MTKPTTNDLITSAMAILALPEDEREVAIKAWIEHSEQKLAALYYTQRAATGRASEYLAEAERWQALAKRERDVAEWAQERARDLLDVERAACGFGPDEPYQVTLPNGVKPGFRLNPPAVQIVDREAIPADLWRHPTPPPPEPDKRKILERLKAAQAVPGAELVRGQRFDWGEPRGSAVESIHQAITGRD